MVVTPGRQVLWHDLECGRYRADLPLWRELAARSCADGAPVLDIAAGTGRVTLDLARRGHAVTALDIEEELVAELARRAEGFTVHTVVADARSFELERQDHGLGLVPMQTVQLLRGAEQRRDMLERARAHVRPGSPVALAIVTDVEEFDARNGSLAPSPDRTRIGPQLYLSRPVRVAVEGGFVRIERERFAEGGGPVEHDTVELELLSSEQLAEEGRDTGLTPQRVVEIPPTSEHAGSEVVVLRA